jgi:hypothetical protein
MAQSDRRLVALPCKLAPGAFSGERIFEVRLADGQRYRSVAPRQFCWNSEGQLVDEREPTNEIQGWVAARIVDQIDPDQLLVEVPDSEVIAVDNTLIEPRPTPIKPPEPKTYVSIGS